ncbi:aspartyl-phosphate phosphatase Spo0E family protein [Halobacillus sp. H74]
MLGNKLGLTHKETFENSQILDELLNEFERENNSVDHQHDVRSPQTLM